MTEDITLTYINFLMTFSNLNHKYNLPKPYVNPHHKTLKVNYIH